MTHPTVAIIIPTLNSPTLGAVIAAVRSQVTDEIPVDLLVVGRDDAGVAEARGARHVAGTTALNPAEARNLGIRSTIADYLIFLDSDCIPEPGWLEAMLVFSFNEGAVVGGAIRLVADQYLRLAGNVASFHEYTTALPAANRQYLPTFSLGVSRRAIARHGGFDERLPRAEDLEFTIRLRKGGHRLYFAPKAAVVHRPSRLSLGVLIDHSVLSGQCSIQVRRMHPDAFQMPTVLLKWQVLLACAPGVATWVAIQAWLRNSDVRRFWPALPIVILTRYLWIIGACQALRADSSIQA